MISQLRYPNKIIQEGNGVNWDNIDNVKVDNWDELAACNLEKDQRPARLIFSDFNFNIPEKAVITHVVVEHDFSKEFCADLISVNPPIIELGDVKKKSRVVASIYPMNREVTFNKDEIDLNIDFVNNNEIKVEFEFPENKSKNAGELYLNFVRLKVIYDFPRYVISSGETQKYFPSKDMPLQKNVGDKFTYLLVFRNDNGLKKDKQEVKINLPEGLAIDKVKFKSHKVNMLDEDVVESVQDEFDYENLIWIPSVRGKSLSTLHLTVKCVSTGSYFMNAFNEYSGYTRNFHVDVHPKGTKLSKNKFESGTSTVKNKNKETEAIKKETVIKAENLSLEFEMPYEKIDNIKEYFIKWIKREIKPKKYFKALNNVSFEINKGERVGIIGFNGAGKSTLLKVLAGVYTPNKGEVEINGNIAPLLELGAGFDHNYSGHENVFLNGAILGYSREFLESKYEEILEFSELGEFMEIPIKNYSSGMKAKLGFSIATVVDPEILILDEILSVGDVKFQKKSGDKIKSMMESGTTVLLVSHSTAKIRDLCTRAIWLDHGKLVMDGDVDYVCDAYIEAAKLASADELKDLEIV